MKKTLFIIFISFVFSFNANADDKSILCPCCPESTFIESAYDYIVKELKVTKKNEEVLRTEASNPDQRIHERDLNIAHYLYQDTKLHYLEAMRDLMSTDDCDACYQAIYLFYNLKLNEYQKGIEKMVRY
jgi:hypothetical protein